MKKVIISLLLYMFLSTFLSAQQPWYKSQIGTGVGNCGPAVAAMVIQWATGKATTVEYIRLKIGYPFKDGRTSFPMLQKVINECGVKINIYRKNRGLSELISIVQDLNAMVIVCIGTGKIKMGASDTPYGRIYSEVIGHYILLDDVLSDYFIVQDPLNSPDRMYKIMQVWEAMGKTNSYFIIIYKY